MKSLLDLIRSIRRHPIKVGGYTFAAFSVIFTIVKAVTHFLPDLKIEGPFALTAAVLISIGYGLKKVWKPSKVDIDIPNSNTVIEVLFGDLFAQSGIRVITANEFFDSKIGRPVSDKSLHGIFIQKCFGGHPEAFDRQLDEQLKGIQCTEVDKVEGKTKKFPIGSTALIFVNDDRYVVFASAKTDPATCKAYADVTILWSALQNLWQRLRNESGGHEVNLPLVCSGLAGLGVPTRDLLNLIILSAITETKIREVTKKIRIVLHRDRFEDLDLRDIKKHWEEK